MPLYDYRCADCLHQTEVLQSASAPAPKTCPNCGQPHLVKVFGSFGIRYGSGGFYNTDYRTKKTDPSASKSESAASPSPS